MASLLKPSELKLETTLSFQLFGSFQAWREGQAIHFATERSQALLAYLILHPDRAHQRLLLAGMLWSEQTDSVILTNLRSELFRLRTALDRQRRSIPLLSIDRQTITLHSVHAQADIWRFRQLLAACQTHVHVRMDRCAACIERLERAVALYTGDLLGHPFKIDIYEFEEWLSRERAGFRAQVQEALTHLIHYYQWTGQQHQVIEFASQKLALDNWDSKSCRHLMQALTWIGQPAVALQEFEQHRQLLLTELEMEPDLETVALAELIREQRLPPPSGLSAPDAPSSPVSANQPLPSLPFPSPQTSFWGRDEELVFLIQRLTDPMVRLLTLTGMGGSGKSRLAMKLATQVADLFPDGIFFVPLASTTTAQAMATVMAETLSVDLSRPDQTLSLLIEYLEQKRILLILDNFEQLLSARFDLLSILYKTSGVRLLVTSRVELGLSEEWHYPVYGLTYPRTTSFVLDSDDPAASPEVYGALALFVDRLRQSRPGFTLTQENLPWAVRICQLTDGFPLALELAAAWGGLMTCRQIASHLEESLDILRSETVSTPERHRQIETILESSWAYLSPSEQQSLRRLSIFPGDFSLEAALEISETTIADLTRLIRKSLLTTRETARLEIHPLLRRLAIKKLEQMPQEKEEIRAEFCRYYCHFLIDRLPELEHGNSLSVLQEAAVEIENSRLAWRQAVDDMKLDVLPTATRGILSLCRRKRWIQQLEADFHYGVTALAAWPDQSADLADSQDLRQAYTIAFGVLLTAYGYTLKVLGQWACSNQTLKQAVEVLRRAADREPGLLASALSSYALNLHKDQDEYRQAHQYLMEAEALFLQLGNVKKASGISGIQGQLYLMEGKLGLARQALLYNLRQSISAGEYLQRGHSYCSLVRLEIDQGRYAKAQYWLDQAQQIAQEQSDPGLLVSTAVFQVILAIQTGRFDEAAAAFDHNEYLAQPAAQSTKAQINLWRGFFQKFQGDLRQASHLIAEALTQLNQVGVLELLIQGNLLAGRLHLELKEIDQARAYYAEACQMATNMGNTFFQAQALMGLVAVAVVDGDTDLQRRNTTLSRALTLSQEVEAAPTILAGLVICAQLAARHDKPADHALAMEFLTLVSTHPASSWESWQQAQHLLQTLDPAKTEQFGSAYPGFTDEAHPSLTPAIHKAQTYLLNT